MKQWVFIIFVLIPSIALASPSITSTNGTISNGQQVTVTGSGFGASGPKIILFDDFGRGSEGQKFTQNATIGSWSTMLSYAFSDSALSRGRGARVITPSGHINNTKLFGGNFSEVFLSSRAYVPEGYRFPMADSLRTMPNISGLKHFWIYYGPYGYGTTGHDLFGPNWTGSSFHRVTSNKTKNYVFQEWGDPGWEWGKPVRWTLWIKGDGINRANTKGFFQGITSTKQVNRKWDSNNMGGKVWFSPEFESKGIPYAFDRLSIVGYFRSGGSYPRDNYVIDDVYVAVGPNSAARIEIGNKSVYSSSTKMAICTPTSWSDGRINFTVREGNFQPGEKAYLFVVDSNNNPSVGYPLTFSGTATSSSSSSSSTNNQPPLPPGKPYVVN